MDRQQGFRIKLMIARKETKELPRPSRTTYPHQTNTISYLNRIPAVELKNDVLLRFLDA
jgi:hypothetical protein